MTPPVHVRSQGRLTRQLPISFGVVAVNRLLFILTLATVVSANGVTSDGAACRAQCGVARARLPVLDVTCQLTDERRVIV